MPVFGIGTWQMGGRVVHNPTNDDARDIAAIKAAIDLGVTHIDTAEMYAAGHAEELVAAAIKGHDRSKLFIVSKVLDVHLSHEDVIRSCKASLMRLNTPYLDLYLIHHPNPRIPLKETMAALDELKEQGLVKNIGVSNFTAERMKEAQSYTKNKIVANQVHYNLLFREPERRNLLKYCQDNDAFLIAWRPVEKGVLTNSGIPLLDALCKKYNKTPAQVAINWLISQKNVITLAKTSSLMHLNENLGAVGWTMDSADIEKLRKEFPGQQDVSNAVPLL